MARGERGGYQAPREPAPVSGPGAQSQRTDGGPGSKAQPIRRIPGQTYGQGQAAVDQQQAAGLYAAPESSPAPGSSPVRGVPAPPPGAPQPGAGGVFGPTERPGESPLAGMMPRGNAIASDVDGFLRVLYSQFPHPAIFSLMRKDM